VIVAAAAVDGGVSVVLGNIETIIVAI